MVSKRQSLYQGRILFSTVTVDGIRTTTIVDFYT